MRTQEARRRIALEAARLISETGLRDYRQAKEKAAARLGIFDETCLPKNIEIEDALREYQRLFHAEDQPRILRERREAAREAMRFFAGFEPRLVGAVLEGTADEHSAVCLHLYTDQPNAVMGLLQERRIAYDEESRRIRVDRDTAREYPALRFNAGDTPIDLTVLPYDLLRQAPLDRVSEKPMRRATAAMLEALLQEP
ncbi:MAG: hypothetical protein ACTHK2_05530 [Dokdonella sp.]|uniref:hypothetical protein n=1 Tax=Dokdonella sp. TaxID=2291710 RepID=UPI003F7DBEBC